MPGYKSMVVIDDKTSIKECVHLICRNFSIDYDFITNTLGKRNKSVHIKAVVIKNLKDFGYNASEIGNHFGMDKISITKTITKTYINAIGKDTNLKIKDMEISTFTISKRTFRLYKNQVLT